MTFAEFEHVYFWILVITVVGVLAVIKKWRT